MHIHSHRHSFTDTTPEGSVKFHYSRTEARRIDNLLLALVLVFMASMWLLTKGVNKLIESTAVTTELGSAAYQQHQITRR